MQRESQELQEGLPGGPVEGKSTENCKLLHGAVARHGATLIKRAMP